MPDIPNFIRESAVVQKNESIARGVYLMRLLAPQLANACRPAQFLQILTDPGLSPFLRRPFSTLYVDREAGWLDIIYDVIGPGTERLEEAKPGDQFHISGPFGLPFDPPTSKRILLIAGGVGLVPLAFLAWEHPDRRADMVYLMGAANTTRLPNMPALLPNDLALHVATDDGSKGHHGFVTELIAEHIIPNDTTILTCGPHLMMARVADIAAELNVPCYASLENHMACGFGACVGCVVEYKTYETDDLRYRRVCLEGPVVNAHEIVW
jgi:dihydroorotate dehydrogenase electron transfer subunit